MRFKRVGSVALVVLVLSQLALASEPVLRVTSDRQADLIDALIRLGRFDDARQLCSIQSSRDSDPEGDTIAKQAIRLCEVLIALQMTKETFDDRDVAEINNPVESILRTYPEHQRKLFLMAQAVAVQRAAARHAVLSAVVAPAQNPSDAAPARLLRADRATSELADEVFAERTRLQVDRSTSALAIIADLTRLEHELRVESVSLALLQTELFAGDPNELVAAATKAEQSADTALAKLPRDSTARSEIERLRIDAILRTGQHQRAAEQHALLDTDKIRSVSPAWAALKIRILLAAGEVDEAEELLRSFYGKDPDIASPSIEMDLARLSYLLLKSEAVGSDTEIVSRWIDSIGRRNGSYATRRAEAISLSRLRSGEPSRTIDASLVAAQGRDWLRRGNAKRAAELLTAAAASDNNSTRAIEHAREAAAAWMATNAPQQATEVLAMTALSNPEGDGAAATHLQSILLHAQSAREHDSIAEELKSSLRFNIGRWPTESSATQARNWLIKILLAENDPVGAAEAALESTTSLSDAELSLAMDLWHSAFLNCKDERVLEFANRCESAFAPLQERSDTGDLYLRAVVTFAPRNRLSQSMIPAEEANADSAFFATLLRARHVGVFHDQLPLPPATLSETVLRCLRRRLMEDGRDSPTIRVSIAKWLDRWPDLTDTHSRDSGDFDSHAQRAERLLWIGQADQAIALLDQHIKADTSSVDRILRAARILAESSDPKATETAIRYFDQVATGSAKGSDYWHDAKIAAIELLNQTKKWDQARQRAQYILLTMPGLDETQKQRYQQLIRPTQP